MNNGTRVFLNGKRTDVTLHSLWIGLAFENLVCWSREWSDLDEDNDHHLRHLPDRMLQSQERLAREV